MDGRLTLFKSIALPKRQNLSSFYQCSKVIMFSRISCWFSYCLGKTKQTQLNGLVSVVCCDEPKETSPFQFLIVPWDSLVLENCCEYETFVWGFSFYSSSNGTEQMIQLSACAPVVFSFQRSILYVLANDVVDKVAKLYLVLLSLVYTFRLEMLSIQVSFGG